MKAAFIHDHHFVYNPNDGKYYDGSGGVFNEKLWKRYLAVFDSLIVVGREKDDLPNKLIDSTCDRVTFELNKDLKRNINRIIKRSLIKKNLEKTLVKVDFAIIRVPSILGYIAQEICEEHGIKYVLEVVACPWDAYINYGNIKGKIIAPLEFLKLKKATKISKNTIYVTQRFLQERYPSNGNTIGISNVNIDEVLMSVPSYNTDILKIGLIGSFHVKYKGHIEALNALKYIVETEGIKNIKLYFVGTGNPDWIIDYAKKINILDYLEIVGTVKAGKDGIFPFLDGIDLYIHPSKQEGLPRVVIEALSRGKLALGSSAAGIPELIDEKFLHSPGDYLKLANDIIYLINHKNEWFDIQSANLDKAQNYLEKELQKNRINFIKDIIS